MLISELQKKHPNLTHTAIILYFWIEEKYKKSGKTSLYYTIKTMCVDTGSTDKTIRESLKSLEAEGLILIDRSEKKYRYSLPQQHKPTPPHPPKKRGNNSAVKNTAKKSPIYTNNIISISGVISDISDNQTQDIDSDPFSAADLSGIEADAAQVRLVFEALRAWRGKKPLYIRHYACPYKVELHPREIRARMRELTPDHIAYVCRSYATQKDHIRHATTWIQSALYYAPERMAQAQTAAVAVGETHALDAPTPAAPKKQRPKFGDFCQRQYTAEDYAAIERMALAASDALLGGHISPYDSTGGAAHRPADRHIGGTG